MLRLPLVSDLRLAFTCLMRPRDGVAYVAARIFHHGSYDGIQNQLVLMYPGMIFWI
jgi:hypothetical protein